jgi:hypothetical protein
MSWNSALGVIGNDVVMDAALAEDSASMYTNNDQTFYDTGASLTATENSYITAAYPMDEDPTASVSDAWHKLAGGAIEQGTVAAKQAIGSLFGAANPPPANRNTNMANKSLLSVVTKPIQTAQALVIDAQGRPKYGVIALIGIGVMLVIALIVRR